MATVIEADPALRRPGATVVGSSILRLEDGPLLVGKGRYLDDIVMPDVLHVAVVRSAVAHAAIAGVDTAAARSVDGVVAVLTLDDLLPVLATARMPIATNPIGGSTIHTPYVLARDEVAFVGEAIALIVARDPYVAEDAAAQVIVDYRHLDVVNDVREGLRAGAPTVRRELTSNVFNEQQMGYGDIDAAFAAAKHVVADELFQHRGLGGPIEGRGVVAQPNASDGSLRVWSSTQMPNELHNMLVETLGLEESMLRVTTPDLGGGFGTKYLVYSEDLAIPAAALLLGRALKWVEDRRESFVSQVQERDQYWSLEMAVDADARILGIRGHVLHDQGAYVPRAVSVPYNAARTMLGPYVVPAFAIDVVVALTNRVPASTIRGAGYPQGAFAMERMLDLVAVQLGLDRAEVRARNLIPAEKMPYTKPLRERSGEAIVYDSGDYPATQAQALEAADWPGFRARQAAALAGGRYIGIGLANMVKSSGRGPFESGTVRVTAAGQVNVFTGAVAMGQGLATALAQICSDELGVAPEQVRVTAGDTAGAPLGIGGFASRQLVTAGSSVHLAAKAVAVKARRLASYLLEVGEDRLELRDGSVRVIDGTGSVTLGDLARRLRGAPGYALPADIEPGLAATIHWPAGGFAYANATHVVEVEVDVELCEVTLRRYVAVHDSGKLVNPMIAKGQVIGGIVHGIGNALFELMAYDENAQPLTTSFAEYLLPAATELPLFEVHFRETPSPMNPIGVKGIGENGTIPTAAAIVSAVEDALSPLGIRLSRTPLTPEALFDSITLARNAERGTHKRL
jgi:carbon-monoxide dehydrogenase large subunit